MDHLDQDHDRLVGLHDPLHIVVQRRQHRRTRCRTEPEETTLGQWPELHVVIRSRPIADLDPPCLAGVRTEQRDAIGEFLTAVLGLVDDRRAPLAIYLKSRIAAVDPERVITSDVSGGARRAVTASGRSLPIGVARLLTLRLPQAFLLCYRRRLLLRQRQLVAEGSGALQRCQGRCVIEPRQIRSTGRRSGDITALLAMPTSDDAISRATKSEVRLRMTTLLAGLCLFLTYLGSGFRRCSP